ncbi:MAG: 30S ribosomal protein S6 [Candidatus Roseilinea sp.]|uniref:30S ribosomal protein S6 n=1 Tax=Candidatus Roseilinea sp. TaxID=2838777 RepID=UPI00404989E2
MSRYYELTLIIKPDIDDAGATALMERVSGFITAEGGKILKSTSWGVRRLMYPIRKFRDGRYVFNLLELDANSVARIENRLKLTEDIIRFLFIRADDDLDVSRLLEAPAVAEVETAVAAPSESDALMSAGEPLSSESPETV